MESADILNTLMKIEGLNPNSLSREMGLNRSQPIYDIINGKVKYISRDYAEKIIAAFPKYDKAWLILGEGEMFKTEHEATNSISNNEINGDGSGNIVNGNMQNVGNSRHYDVPASGFLKIIYPDGREETIAGDSSILELSNEIKLLKAENAHLTDKITMKDEVIDSMKELVLELKHKQ